MKLGRIIFASLAVMLFIGCEKREESPAVPSTQPVGATEEHYLEATARPPPIVPVTPATRPSGPLPQGASCVTAACHVKLATARQIHEPVAKNACEQCHDPDIGGHKYPLKRVENNACTFCHSTVAGNAQHQHKALENGCIACHNPHASNAKFLLKFDNVEQTCTSCHKIPLKKSAHGPFAQGDCTLCHQPHQSDFAKLLRGGEGKNHCFTCHGDLRVAMNKSTNMHKPAVKDCVICHDPHTSDSPKQLKKAQQELCFSCHEKTRKHIEAATDKHAALVIDKGCSNCHSPHASDQPSLLRARTDKVCFNCHDKPLQAVDGRTIPNMKALMTQAKFLHGANKAGNCNACHDPHGSNQRDLLERSFPDTFYARFDVSKYALCWSCHEKQVVLTAKTRSLTNFRNGDLNLHFVHVNRDEKGRSCKSCHDVHASDLPNHMATDVRFEGSSWAMPIEYQKTADGGSCTPGCHKTRTYSRSATTVPTTRGVP